MKPECKIDEFGDKHWYLGGKRLEVSSVEELKEEVELWKIREIQEV